MPGRNCVYTSNKKTRSRREDGLSPFRRKGRWLSFSVLWLFRPPVPPLFWQKIVPAWEVGRRTTVKPCRRCVDFQNWLMTSIQASEIVGCKGKWFSQKHLKALRSYSFNQPVTPFYCKGNPRNVEIMGFFFLLFKVAKT